MAECARESEPGAAGPSDSGDDDVYGGDGALGVCAVWEGGEDGADAGGEVGCQGGGVSGLDAGAAGHQHAAVPGADTAGGHAPGGQSGAADGGVGAEEQAGGAGEDCRARSEEVGCRSCGVFWDA